MTAHPCVLLHAVSFRHSSAVPVLDGLDLDLRPGWTGLVGPNGAGKTTLLRLIAGEVAPTAGRVQVVADVPPVLCRQDVEPLDDPITAFAADWSGEPSRLRSRLHLDVDDLARWSSLSPGERRRWQVATALAGRPDVLLLDEPTNHLDADGRDLLVDALRRFEGVGLVVSHDRGLLDALTTRTVRLLGPGRVEDRPGSWARAREAWLAEETHEADVERAARREERRLRRVLADVSDRRRSVEASSARIRRHAGHTQPDARETGRQVAAAKAEAALAARTRQVRARVDRAATAGGEVHRTRGGDVALREAGGRRREVARLRADRIEVDGVEVLRDVDVAVGRGDRIHVAGPNGSGKTTLLRHLVRPGDGIGVLAQEHDLAARRQLVADLAGLDPDQRGRVLGTVALLGVDPDRLLVTSLPSPGEARKLALAHLLVTAHDLVVLDEPTNHLDLPAIERLQDALADHTGALLLVTHDDALAAACTDLRWTVGDGRVETG